MKQKRTGRPLMGAEPRVRVFAHVARATDDQLRAWRLEAHAEDPSAKLGQVVDKLVEHGLASKWSPVPKPEEFESFEDAFEVCRERDRPITVTIVGKVGTVFPSGHFRPRVRVEVAP